MTNIRFMRNNKCSAMLSTNKIFEISYTTNYRSSK